MKVRNVRKFINAATQDDIKYVAKRAGITYEYLLYHVATGRKVLSEDTAALVEKASLALSKRKPHIPRLRCTDFIDSYERCPHEKG